MTWQKGTIIHGAAVTVQLIGMAAALASYEKPVHAGTVPPVNPVIVDYTLVSSIIKSRYPLCKSVRRRGIGISGYLALMVRYDLQDKVLKLEEVQEKAHESVA